MSLPDLDWRVEARPTPIDSQLLIWFCPVSLKWIPGRFPGLNLRRQCEFRHHGPSYLLYKFWTAVSPISANVRSIPSSPSFCIGPYRLDHLLKYYSKGDFLYQNYMKVSSTVLLFLQPSSARFNSICPRTCSDSLSSSFWTEIVIWWKLITKLWLSTSFISGHRCGHFRFDGKQFSPFVSSSSLSIFATRKTLEEQFVLPPNFSCLKFLLPTTSSWSRDLTRFLLVFLKGISFHPSSWEFLGSKWASSGERIRSYKINKLLCPGSDSCWFLKIKNHCVCKLD